MASNYPPGVSDSTFGAPWNDIEIEKEVVITLKTTLQVSFQGPAQISDEQILEAMKEVIKEDLKKTQEDYEIASVEFDT